MKIYVLACIISFCEFVSFSQFEQINVPTSEEINSVSNIGNDILIGDTKQMILRTDNNFSTNVIINSPALTSDASWIYRIDNTTLYLRISRGAKTIIYRSINQGETWDLKLDQDSLIGSSFRMFDSSNGILLCLLNKCLLTNDGGTTWYSRSLLPSFPIAAEIYGNSTICTASMNGFAISDDMGLTWIGNGVNADNGIQSNFHFLNRDTIYAVTQPPALDGFLAYSYDHGNTWSNIYFQGENQIKPHDVHFFSTLEGYVCGKKNATYATIMKTLDGGQTWETFNSGIGGTFFNITFINDSIALLGGSNGLLVRWNKNSNQVELLSLEADKLGISIYPNPSTAFQQIKIETASYRNLYVDLVDANGKQINRIVETTINQDVYILENDISPLQAGTYFYKVQLDNLTKTISFVKE